VILALVTLKGGAGKTTSAVHLAAALARKRGAGRVVLLDGDPHASAIRWAARGPGLPFDVRPVTEGAAGAQHVIVDTAAGEAHADLLTVARQASRVIIPTPPVPLDLVATLDTARLLASVTRPLVLLTRCPPWTQPDAAEARAMLEARDVHVLRTEVPNRKAYQTAALDGVTVREVRDRDAETLWGAWPRLLREVTA
jgi:chromosome partitioning protein